ncbi:pseudaminic acid cytidylyltransferase [Lacimicrobium alkaliphilum]|uniref:Pseudaminic acid cytidylyltransferase n=1 Tax=Lacimicrobium alkaliphilum TaxID=1526571 RepID=A0ABQ1RMC2_9ALTE|nr:pseudaminic acid cytidylyltransferase [Lacimicrobium alkaliphilum]GGD72398.1 pseudaminic acid cytidylyltransferase [Lacimicrobium alkaliphilum]
MQKIAIIPARGGSKRIPDKNIRDFCGKPLIAYSIQAALKADLFDKVIVSTDSEKVANVALGHGAEVPFIRPAELSDDYTGTSAVVVHAIQECQRMGLSPELVCCIYATAPLIQQQYLQRGFKALRTQAEKHYAFSVTEFAFPVQRALIQSDNGGIQPMFPEYIGKRSQDLPVALHDAGQFYWGRSEAFLASKKVFAPHSVPIILPHYLVQDIDTLDDWQRAELLYRAYYQHSSEDKK